MFIYSVVKETRVVSLATALQYPGDRTEQRALVVTLLWCYGRVDHSDTEMRKMLIYEPFIYIFKIRKLQSCRVGGSDCSHCRPMQTKFNFTSWDPWQTKFNFPSGVPGGVQLQSLQTKFNFTSWGGGGSDCSHCKLQISTAVSSTGNWIMGSICHFASESFVNFDFFTYTCSRSLRSLCFLVIPC